MMATFVGINVCLARVCVCVCSIHVCMHVCMCTGMCVCAYTCACTYMCLKCVTNVPSYFTPKTTQSKMVKINIVFIPIIHFPCVHAQLEKNNTTTCMPILAPRQNKHNIPMVYCIGQKLLNL